VRASDTARGACAVYGEGALAEIYEPLSTGFDAASALALFDGRDPDAHIMVVGHEPTLAGAIAGLSGAQIKLKKGGIAMVDVSDASVLSANGAFQELTGGEAREPGEPPGELVVLVRPRELAHIAGMALSEV
jgi:phosphohistidine phosphatase SixA